MPEEWFEVAYINFDKAILHGRIRVGFVGYDRPTEKMIEQVLTDHQKRQIEDLNEDHREAMQKLLRSFVNEDC